MRRLLLAALALMACAGPHREAAAPAARHLLLVTIDTLRADRLGSYGNRDGLTPNLDRLAREGALAPHATVHVPLTRPSHVSLLTGLYPAEHGIRDNVSPSLADKFPTLASLLAGARFRTAAFVSSIVLSAQSGLSRGFRTYSDRFEAGEDDARFLNTIQKRGDLATAEAIAWLESRSSERLFAWVHLYDPHDPYAPPEPYATRYAGRPYDGEVAFTDELVGRLDAALERLTLRGETLIVVTSDHGEGLGEHGEAVHGFFVYESTLRVPLILRGPGIPAGARLGVTARSVDVLPTLLDLLGVARPAGAAFSGRSLAAALRGGQQPVEEPSYAECLVPLLHYGWSDLRSLGDGRYKYIQAPRPELYDLREDPGELRNLAATEPAKAEALRAGLETRLRAEKAVAATGPGAAGVPPDLLEKLGALGYLGAGRPPLDATTGADPKDKLDEYQTVNVLVREGLTKLQEQDFAASASRFQELLGRGISSFEVHYYLARALAGLDRHRDAARHFATAVERLPGYAAAYVGLADSRIALGETEGALLALRQGQAQAPKNRVLHEREARVLRKLGKLPEAARAYEAALRLAPKDALLRVELGELRRDEGKQDDAVRLLREAVALDPEPASYWNSLGMLLGGDARFAEAEAAFREAVRRDPRDAQYAYNLGLALQRQGRKEEAAEAFRGALRLAPGFAAARQRLGELGRP